MDEAQVGVANKMDELFKWTLKNMAMFVYVGNI